MELDTSKRPRHTAGQEVSDERTSLQQLSGQDQFLVMLAHLKSDELPINTRHFDFFQERLPTVGLPFIVDVQFDQEGLLSTGLAPVSSLMLGV